MSVILATVLSLVDFLLASYSSSSNPQVTNIHGNCNNIGNNNTNNCVSTSPGSPP